MPIDAQPPPPPPPPSSLPPSLPPSLSPARTTSAQRVVLIGRSYFAFPRGWGKAAAAALGVLIAYNLLYLLWLAFSLTMIRSGVQSEQGLQPLDMVGDALRAVGLVVMLAVAVCFLGWQWTVVHNLSFFGNPRPRYGPGFSCFAWFLPIANLFIPYQSIADVLPWSGKPVKRSIEATLLPWWLLCLATAFTGTIARVLMSRATSAPVWTVAGLFDGVRGLCAIAAAVLAIRFVGELSERQESRHESIAAAALFD